MKNYLILIIAAGLMSGCASKNQSAEKQAATTNETEVVMTAAQIQNAGIVIGSYDTSTLSSEIKVNGMVDVPPQNIVSVSFPMGGYLKSTRLLPGMHVNKGEVIGIIEDQALIQLQQDYLVAIARLQYLQQDFDRQKLLNENKVNADKIFQQAAADLASQKAIVKGLSEKLRLIHIDPQKLTGETISRSVPVYSPINGFVSKVNVNIGKYVNATDVLFELINPDDLHASLTVYEKDLEKIKPGQKVNVWFVDDPSRQYLCEVLLVTKNVDENRSALVHCHFETRPDHLLPGMFLNASISISTTNAVTVPEDAVARYGNGLYIFAAMDSNTFKMEEVKTGVTSKGKIELVNAPNIPSGKIVVKNAYAVLAKMKNTGEEE
jgi:cobalt-zinc-cadmium efflux system membrane fusion protein